MYDLIITGGKVFDGTGNPWFRADIGVKDGRIAALVRVPPQGPSPLLGQGELGVDASGKVVAPGFIDTHSHSDVPLLINPTADSKIMQGVTTEVIGQCGSSPAPLNDRSRPVLMAQVRGIPQKDLKWDWTGYGEYLEHLAAQGTAVNVAGVVGHGAVRVSAMGFEERGPTKAELEEMCRLVRQSIEEGAFGFSTGLIYTPGSYSKLPELIALAQAAGKAGGIYFTHMRSEGQGLFEAVAEALEIGRQGRLAVHISHLKAMGPAQGKAGALLGTLERARAEGLDVTADQYPYVAGATGLAALLPPWAHEGGRDQMVVRLKDPEQRRRMRQDMQGTLPGWDNDFRAVGFPNIMLSRCENAAYQGRRVQEIADAEGQDPYELVFDILAETDPGTGMIIFAMREEDVRQIMAHDLVMVGTDASGVRPDGVLGQGKPHPRSYGTFPRVLGPYVRDHGVLTLQQAIRKMTSASANRLGLTDRGQVRQGFWADLVVFDPETVRDRATFEQPHQFPEGIEHVLVNGQLAVSGGKHTGKLAGRVLRRGG